MILTFHLFPKPVYFGTECAPPSPFPTHDNGVSCPPYVNRLLAMFLNGKNFTCHILGRHSR